MVKVDLEIIIPDSSRMSALNPKATSYAHNVIDEVTGNVFVRGRQASLNKMRREARKVAKKARLAAAKHNATKHKTGKPRKNRKTRKNRN